MVFVTFILVMNWMKIPAVSFLFLLCLFPKGMSAQPVVDSLSVLEIVVIDGDTFPMFNFQTITILDSKKFTKRQRRRYGRLKRYVVKVYPYAELAGEMLQDFDDTLKSIKSDAKRKKYIKAVEASLKEEFEGELKRLTIKQGILLVKLIDRETGNTSYDLIKSLRGSFSAFLWQSLARLFGSNLKLEYDPEGEDALVEEIVLQLENGEIPYKKRERKLKI